VKGAFRRTIHLRCRTKLLIDTTKRASTPPIPGSCATEQSSESKKTGAAPLIHREARANSHAPQPNSPGARAFGRAAHPNIACRASNTASSAANTATVESYAVVFASISRSIAPK
jgi:hypothetical protein